MCGRYARAKDRATLIEEFEVTKATDSELAADYNVAPTKKVYIVAARTEGDDEEPQRQLQVAQWGLVPSWAKDRKIGSRLINARIETATSKPSFRSAFAKRRCLLPADGFYEWYETQQLTANGKPKKQPFYITPHDGGSLAMAGLYEFWKDPDPAVEDPWLVTCTILTTTSTDELGRIHDRMPFHVRPDERTYWLDPAIPAAAAAEFLVNRKQPAMDAIPVSTAVNNVRNNGPELIEPIPLD